MSFLDYFRTTAKRRTASLAKERLQIIVAHERAQRGPEYLPQLQHEILQVIGKYVKIDQKDVQVQFDRNEDCAVLELNINLPET